MNIAIRQRVLLSVEVFEVPKPSLVIFSPDLMGDEH
jgi:hypothetical protein